MIEPGSAFELGADETITCFLHHSHDIRANGRVHFARLMPDRSGERSAAHITDLAAPEIWRLGAETLSPPDRVKVTGRADLLVQAVGSAHLRAFRDDIGFTRHATIVGWPMGEAEKSARQEIARGLAQAAVTFRRPPD